MAKFSAGTVAWAQPDPTNAHSERPIVVLSHENRPFSSTNCTVMCFGTSAKEYDHSTPELEDKHLSGISFGDGTYLMPWAIYSIAPGHIRTERITGTLTDEGKTLVKRELVRLLTD